MVLFFTEREMIDKKSVLITSAGRTGTAFLADLFGRIVEQCDSFHEPDVFKRIALGSLLAHWGAVRNFGLFQYTLGKVCGKGGIRSLSVARIANRLPSEVIASALLEQRRKFVDALPGPVYVESSNQLHGLIDIIPLVFSQCRIIFVVRDGRAWVRSRMNSGRWFCRGDVLSYFNRRLSPLALDHHELASRWRDMSRFEKLCWSWTAINGAALRQVVRAEMARTFKFEELFHPPHGCSDLAGLLSFATSFDGEHLSFGSLNGALKKKVNVAPTNSFPAWQDWSADQRAQFERHCGELMHELGYW